MEWQVTKLYVIHTLNSVLPSSSLLFSSLPKNNICKKFLYRHIFHDLLQNKI